MSIEMNQTQDHKSIASKTISRRIDCKHSTLTWADLVSLHSYSSFTLTAWVIDDSKNFEMINMAFHMNFKVAMPVLLLFNALKHVQRAE